MIQPQAVIEIGSTGVRLLVAELSEDNKRTILDRSDMPLALGRDVFTSGTISLDTQSQCLHILNRFAEQLAGWGITRQNTTVIATSAVREANNRDPFVDRIKIKTGFTVRVIDGIEENRLMYIAVRECLKGETKRVLQSNSVILEIAGGSTEIMLMEKGRMAGAHALRLGTVIIEQKRLSMMGTMDDARRYIEEFISNTKTIIDSELTLGKVQQFIAVGSDMRLASLFAGKPISPFLWQIKREDFNRFVDEVQEYSLEECIARFKLSYSDAETFQVSLLAYRMFIDLTRVQTILVPETSIREGLLISKSTQPNEELQKEFTQQIAASARILLRKYHGDEAHAEYVKNVCLKLFDALSEEIALDEKARLLLEISAILHDIGMFIRAVDHNVHSQYIILHSEIFGLTRDDTALIGQIVRYHRGHALPQDDSGFKLLPRNLRLTILKLTSLLRIADALDRAHRQRLTNLTFSTTQDTLTIRTQNAQNLALEKLALEEKGDLFENVFGYKIVLV